MSLWLVHILLVVLTLLLLLKPLTGRQAKLPGEDGRWRRGLLANRLAEIEGECSVGLIDPGERAQAERETELFYNAPGDGDTPGERLVVSPVASVGVVVLVLAATGFYFAYSDGYRLLLQERQVEEVVADFKSMTSELLRRLEKQPGDTEARLRLAEAYYLFGDYASAVTQYRLANESGAVEESNQWLNYADALLHSGNIEQADAVIGALSEILESEADNQRALFIAAFLHFERSEYPRAIELWQRLLDSLPEDQSTITPMLREFILRAEAEIASANAGKKPAEAEAITVAVSLAGTLRPLATLADTVFVYARAIGGSPVPIAIKRLTVADLPARISLSDEDTMMRGTSLGHFDQVEIVARVSKGGQAATAPGDLIGVLSPVAVGASVTLNITEVVD